VQVESLNSAKEEFLQRKLFLTGGKFLLVIILLLLLGNYFSFSHYWSEKNNLDAKLQTDGGALAGLRELEKQVEVKRSFLEQAGLLRSSSPSYYADQLAAELPDEISLTRMNLAPRLKLSEEDSIAFKPGHIEIDGSCSQSVVLNTWLQSLKTKKWIKSAILQSYVQDKNMKQGEFEIALVLE
jgi:Tfp pilus assembly protein PilN